MIATERRNCTLLLVEDSHDEVFFMRRAWREQPAHYYLTHVNDGEEAKAFLLGLEECGIDQGDELPRIILSDLLMPHCNGIQLLTWVRAHPRFKQVPFVIWSTSQYRSDIDAAYTNGANGYLFKPRDFAQEATLMATLRPFWTETRLSPEQLRLPYPD